MHWLGEYLEFVTPRQSILKQSARVVITRDEEYLALGKKFADLNRGLNAVHLRHHDTCHEEVELTVTGKFDARFTAVRDRRLKAIHFQHHGNSVSHCYIVIYNESVRLSPVAVSGRRGKLRLRVCHGYTSTLEQFESWFALVLKMALAPIVPQ